MGNGDYHKILAAYRKEIKELLAGKVGVASGFKIFFIFFVKCKSLLSENKMHTCINNPDVI